MQIDAIDVLLTSGLLGTIVTVVAKWLHDRKKIPLEREAVLASASETNVTSALAIAAEARATAQATKERYDEDTKRERDRHDREMGSVVERLTRLEDTNRDLTHQVQVLKDDDAVKSQRITNLEDHVGRVEGKLAQARQKIVDLLEYIKAHTTGTGEIPVVDLTIFDK